MNPRLAAPAAGVLGLDPLASLLPSVDAASAAGSDAGAKRSAAFDPTSDADGRVSPETPLEKERTSPAQVRSRPILQALLSRPPAFDATAYFDDPERRGLPLPPTPRRTCSSLPRLPARTPPPDGPLRARSFTEPRRVRPVEPMQLGPPLREPDRQPASSLELRLGPPTSSGSWQLALPSERQGSSPHP